jgi:hypothetical protein
MCALSRPTSDFVTSTISGAIDADDTTITIGTGLSIPATNSFLQLDYASTEAVGAANGPETIFYAAYNTSTGALTGVVRGQAGTTGVAHENGAEVQAGMSAALLEGFVGARAYLQSALTTTAASTYTKITLASETYDVGANFADSKFTAPVDGYYMITGAISFAAATADKVHLCSIYKNGSAIFGAAATPGSTQTSATASDIVYLAATDYVELYYYHEGATTTDINAGPVFTYMTVILLKEV